MVMFSKINTTLFQQEKILRIFSFIAHLCALLYMRDLIVKTIEYYDEKTTSLSDYSIQIKDIHLQDKVQSKINEFLNEVSSKSSIKKQNLTKKNILNNQISVQEIILLPQLTQYYEMIETKKKLIEQKRKLYLNKDKLSSKIGPEFQQNQNQILTINTKILEQNQRIEQKKLQFKFLSLEDKLKSQKAIIVLNSQRQKNHILYQFENDKQFFELLKKHFGQSATSIRIKQAPQPNEIIWANINYTRQQKIIGHIIGWSLSILTLTAVTILYYFLVTLKTKNLLDSIETNKTLQAAHMDEDYIFAVILVYLNLIFIVLFNKFVLGLAFYKFTLLQKHQNTSNEEFSFAIKYAMGMFFTTALMTLAVEDVTFHNFYSHQYGVIEEESVMFFINAFFVPLIWLVNPQQVYVLIQRYFYKRKDFFTQQEANKIMADSNYKMGKRYAQVIKTMWFTFLYSTLIPFGAFISFLGLSIYYWVDKYNLLRRSSIIQNISGKLAIKCMKLLDITLVLRQIGALIFDYQLRHEISVFEVCFSLVGLIYLFLPMNKILRFFHEEKFLQVQQSYQSLKDTFKQTYQTLNPIYTSKLILPQVINDILIKNENQDSINQAGDSMHNIYFVEQNQQITFKVYIKPKINDQNDGLEKVKEVNEQQDNFDEDQVQNEEKITKRSLRKRLKKIQFSKNQKENIDTLNFQNEIQIQIKSAKKSNKKCQKIITPMKINNIR